jgi:hypothetical protein
MTIRKIFYRTVFGCLLSSIGLYSFVLTHDIHAQSADARSLITRTVSTGPSGPSPASVPAAKTDFSAFNKAAGYNAGSLTTLAWNFGGKTQSGWDIYADLIANTVGADAEPDSAEFAQSISVWQAKNGISPTGSLDAATLSSLTGRWQSQRLGRSDYPSPDRLVTAPPSDFYDPARDVALRQLERDTYAAYKKMVSAAARDLRLKTTDSGDLAADEKFLKIVSAFRSREYQEQLRQQSPGSGRAGLAKFSAHATGQAIDMYVGGEPVTTKDANRRVQVQTPAYKWLVKNAAKFGFHPYFYEPWHWEYVPGK